MNNIIYLQKVLMVFLLCYYELHIIKLENIMISEQFEIDLEQ